MLRHHVKQSAQHAHIVNKTTPRWGKQRSDNVHPTTEGLLLFFTGKMKIEAKAHSLS